MSASKQQAPDSMEQGLQPCPAASSAGAEQALGGNPSGTLPPAPQRCSFPVAFALSPPACLLCRRAEADPGLCGDKVEKRGLCAHVFCLFFASGLFQRGAREAGLVGFLPKDIQSTVARAAQKHCFVCGESGATISCRETGCNRSFHLPCAVEGGCVTQFFRFYRAFCWEHRPEQAVEAVPEENTTCLICLDLVEERKSYGTMVCPACKHAWFHRGCIQGQALCAGRFCFQCPLCRDKEHFLSEMLTMGIRIPLRLPSWEIRHEYAELGERHRRCDARECLCPGGREQAEQEGPWQLLLCCSCAAEGTHRRCSDLTSSTASWECDACAGLGTASSASSELAGPNTASQAGSGQSLSSLALQTRSPGNAASGPSQGPPVPEGSSRSSPPGPDRMRKSSRLRRRAQHPYSRPRRCRDRIRAPAPNAETSTRSQAAPGPSHSSPAPETSGPSTASQLPAGSSSGSPALESSGSSSPPGPVRMRDRSHLQRRAQHPYSRPGRRHGTSRAPSSSAGPDPPPPVQ
ncbi:PHD finger protein 7-like [Accipiter gentilis]|uniref:PHD finger protein 7-like n=1 Tax=Astur gentilis TaxID=8957 RepID=UPI00210F345A|nr:PHD finger protein 7-like [Accipiter gentilis]XP_049682989.1 PHD finger protein 7-like [Accipiter gentilis]